MTMVHHRLDRPSPRLRAELDTLFQGAIPMASVGYNHFDYAMRSWLNQEGHSHPSGAPTRLIANEIATRLAMPIFTVEVSNWRTSRDAIFAWLTEQYADLGVGVPDERLRIKSNWVQKRYRSTGTRTHLYLNEEMLTLPVHTLQPREYYAEVKRHVGALRRFTDNTDFHLSEEAR